MSLHGPAAARLYDDHVDAVYSYIARRLGPEYAIDVVGRVFEHALRASELLGDATPSPTAADEQRAWLLGIATTLLHGQWTIERQRLRSWTIDSLKPTNADVSDPLLGTGGGAMRSETPRTMAAVAELEPIERDLLFLLSWERCDIGIVARALDIPASSVRSRHNAVRKQLKRHLRRLASDDDVGVDGGVGVDADADAAENVDVDVDVAGPGTAERSEGGP